MPRDPQKRYFAVDLDVHNYKYITRAGVASTFNYLDRLEMGYGLVVEARKEPQMPEQMISAIKVIRFDGKCAVPFPPGTELPAKLTAE